MPWFDLLPLREEGIRKREGIRRRGSYSGADGEVAAKAHARGADEADAGREGEEVVNCGARVCVIRLEGLPMTKR